MKLSEYKNYIINKYGETGWKDYKSTYAYYIYSLTEEGQKRKLQEYGEVIRLIKNPSEELQLLALSISHYSLLYMHNLSERVMKEAVNGDNFDRACALKYIENDLKEEE